MISTYNAFASALLTVLAVASAGAAVNPTAKVIGTVTLKAADGSTVAAEGARVVMACVREGTLRTEVSDEHGSFRFLNVPIDTCSIEADVQGFVAPPIVLVAAADQVVAINLHLGIVPLRTGVNVRGIAPLPALKRLASGCALTHMIADRHTRRHAHHIPRRCINSFLKSFLGSRSEAVRSLQIYLALNLPQKVTRDPARRRGA